MQFTGRIRRIGENSIEFVIDENENKDVVLANAARLSKHHLTIYTDQEYRVTKLQKEKIKSMIFDIVRQSTDLPDDVRTPEVMQQYLKKRLGVDTFTDLMKEEASMTIQSIKEFCEDNGFDMSGAKEDQSQLLHHINVSNKSKACVKCGNPGETFDLKDFHSKLITEFRMGYRFITLCDIHYFEVLDKGVAFFKDNLLIMPKN